jgi:hypothetical protein
MSSKPWSPQKALPSRIKKSWIPKNINDETFDYIVPLQKPIKDISETLDESGKEIKEKLCDIEKEMMYLNANIKRLIDVIEAK